MNETIHFLEHHGASLLFAAVFLEQMGLPLPALPWLLAFGALSATGNYSPIFGIGLTIVACGAADAFWFYLGRYRGARVMNLLCRLSLEADSCVRRTQNLYTRYGMKGVVVAKFLPGLSLLVPPLAGMTGTNAGRFFVVDGFASMLYGSCYVGLGFLFHDQIDDIASAIARIGGGALALALGVAAIYIGLKYWRRQRLLRELRMARITVEEVRKKQDAGEDMIILDLRSREELKSDPTLIQGAIHFDVNEVESRHQEFPRDRDIILYCSCPNEVTSAKVALLLRRKGITRVRPLLGGFDAWRDNHHPLTTKAVGAKEPAPQSRT